MRAAPWWSLAEFTLGAISLAAIFPKPSAAEEDYLNYNNDRLEHFPGRAARPLGLLGYGSVARKVARPGRAFGM